MRLETRILRYPPEKLSFQFSTISGLQVSFLRKRDILEYPVPILGPSNPFITFRSGRSFPALGIFEIDSQSGWHITSKIVLESLLCKMFLFTMLIIIICNPRTTPPPNPECSGNWEHSFSFSGGYLRIRGTNLSFKFQWDFLRALSQSHPLIAKWYLGGPLTNSASVTLCSQGAPTHELGASSLMSGGRWMMYRFK